MPFPRRPFDLASRAFHFSALLADLVMALLGRSRTWRHPAINRPPPPSPRPIALWLRFCSGLLIFASLPHALHTLPPPVRVLLPAAPVLSLPPFTPHLHRRGRIGCWMYIPSIAHATSKRSIGGRFIGSRCAACSAAGRGRYSRLHLLAFLRQCGFSALFFWEYLDIFFFHYIIYLYNQSAMLTMQSIHVLRIGSCQSRYASLPSARYCVLHTLSTSKHAAISWPSFLCILIAWLSSLRILCNQVVPGTIL